LFYVFVAESVTEPPADQLEEDFRRSYISDLRIQSFLGTLAEWREEADIQFNQRGINGL
jgi:hypothetical protein